MIIIKEASITDVKIIREIAHQTWPLTYGEILSEEQLNFMLSKFYSDEALNDNIQKGHHFILATEDNICLGFAAFEHNYLKQKCTRIHKIYILPSTQGKGIGKMLVDFIEKSAKENQSVNLSLNVNRFNSALNFYQKIGFEIVGDEDIEIGNGYLMEDFRMKKSV